MIEQGLEVQFSLARTLEMVNALGQVRRGKVVEMNLMNCLSFSFFSKSLTIVLRVRGHLVFDV